MWNSFERLPYIGVAIELTRVIDLPNNIYVYMVLYGINSPWKFAYPCRNEQYFVSFC